MRCTSKNSSLKLYSSITSDVKKQSINRNERWSCRIVNWLHIAKYTIGLQLSGPEVKQSHRPETEDPVFSLQWDHLYYTSEESYTKPEQLSSTSSFLKVIELISVCDVNYKYSTFLTEPYQTYQRLMKLGMIQYNSILWESRAKLIRKIDKFLYKSFIQFYHLDKLWKITSNTRKRRI